MDHTILIPHLFRTEYSRITAVLCKYFGTEHLADAEDIAGETFALACETWPYKGIPAEPTGWLHVVARNKALNLLKRQSRFRAISRSLDIGTTTEINDIDFSSGNITDSQLQMLFAICHPALPEDAQVGLALRILCGFGIEEIASAFLTSKETINKRLYRAREKLKKEQVNITFPPAGELHIRLGAVLKTLYLLFSEGYYSECTDTILRKDLCLEAMRLTYMLTDNPDTDVPDTAALLSLMCFHSSRFGARISASGSAVLYDEQDTTLWNQQLIDKGIFFLHKASRGNVASAYHYEANIAMWHTNKDSNTGKWAHVLQLYDGLLALSYTPIAALNRIYALWQVHGTQAAITEAKQLALDDNQYYNVLLGQLYGSSDQQLAITYWQKALSLARSGADRAVIQNKIDQLRSQL